MLHLPLKRQDSVKKKFKTARYGLDAVPDLAPETGPKPKLS
jgi:hypothetical protein